MVTFDLHYSEIFAVFPVLYNTSLSLTYTQSFIPPTPLPTYCLLPTTGYH